MTRQLVKMAGFILLIIMGVSCEQGPCIEGNNDIVTKTRNIGSYNEIKLMGSYNITCNKDTSYDIDVTGESNIIPYISTEISNNTLKVKDFPRTCLNENYPVQIDTYLPALNGINLTGNGNIDVDTFSGNTIELHINGSGNLYASLFYNKINTRITGSGDAEINGVGDYASYEISGSGTIYALNCDHEHVDIEISGSGSVYVHCTKTLNIEISGSGSVYYTGYPVINDDISGSGQIINYN
jgi:hypothetical protein